jgi:DNA end-binding protein Ku
MATATRKRKKAAKPKPRHRASWRGMMQFGLVTIPVQAINARRSADGDVHFHQLHDECHSRIKYVKTCPIHGEVSNDEIVSGYEIRKGTYVEIDPDELDELRTEKEKALTIDAFVDPGDVDPLYFDGRMYYVVPNGAEAVQPFSVFLKALERRGKVGVGQIVMSGKQQVLLLRPYENVMHMAFLNYADEIQRPDKVAVELPRRTGADKTLKLAEQLIDGWTDDSFDLSQYVDVYQDEVKQLINAKAKGKELVRPPEAEEPEVLNLVDALRRSVAHERQGAKL